MSATEEHIRRERMIPVSAQFGLKDIPQLCRLLENRRRYARHYLDTPGVDKEAVMDSIEAYNKMIKDLLGL